MALEEKGFVVNTKTISMLMGLAGLFGLLWQGIGYAKSFEAADTALSYRMETIEKWIIEREKSTEKLNTKLDGMIEKITEQTIALRSLETQMKEKVGR